MRILIVNDDGIKAPGTFYAAWRGVGCGTKEPVQRDVTANHFI